jgi:hypothetical protein
MIRIAMGRVFRSGSTATNARLLRRGERSAHYWCGRYSGLLGILALYFGFWMLHERSLTVRIASRDECFSWRLVQYSFPEAIRRTAADVHPPLYYIVLDGWSDWHGGSISALRMLSIILVIGAMLTAASASRLKVEFRCFADSAYGGARNETSGLLVPAIMAVHVVQLQTAGNARMYSLGVFLAALTAWILIKTMDSSRQPGNRWWIAYGLAVAAFCYTHYYAFFTVLAQAAFVGLVAARLALARSWQAFRELRGGFGIAILVAGLVYAPWIPALLGQLGDVRRNFWLGIPTWEDIGASLSWWITGYEPSHGSLWWLSILPFVALVVHAVRRRGSTAVFWLLQAMVPWFAAVSLSWSGGSAVFIDRGLAFAHIGLVVLLSLGVDSLSHRVARAIAVCVVIGIAGMAALKEVDSWPDEPPPITRAMDFVKEGYRDGDIILATWFAEVNRLQYYAEEAGIPNPSVRAILTKELGPGHTMHIASLNEYDILLPSEITRMDYVRFWEIDLSYGSSLQHVAHPSIERTFKGSNDEIRCTVCLYVKESGQWAGTRDPMFVR